MADNLIFPIGFDLETAVKKAESEGASAMKRLDNIFSRQPLALRLDNSGFEKYTTELGKNIDQLKARLKELRTQFDAIPLNQKWEQNNGVKTLTAHAKELWDELLRITEILKGVGQGAQQMANQSIREIDKEIAALERLKQKEIEARQAKQTKQLQTEWNAAADQHKKNTLAEEKRLQEESNRIRKEAEAIARREAEIEKLIVEHKMRQTEAQQAKKRASDEDYANLVRQLREEERLSAEKARQKALDMRRERQAEATAAIERERAARHQLFEAKRQQWQAEQNAINSQSLSYDALMAKLQAWQNIQNRNEVGSKRWEEASRAIRQTKEMLALVTEEMNRAAKAAERIRALREILAANERTMSGLNAKLAEYNSRIQGLEVGSAKFNKTSLEIRRLTEELQKATQQMQDFQQKSFQGVSDSLTKGKVQALTQMREQLRQFEADFNRLNQTGAAFNANGGLTTAANDILRQREAIIKQINQMLVTASDAQIQREKEINRIVEQRKAKADAIAAKRKAEQAAIQGNIAKLKDERRILNQQESSIASITAKLQIQQQRLQSAKFGSAEFEKIAKEVERLTNKLDKANQKVRELTGQTQSGAARQSAAVREASGEFKKQETYVSRLLKRMAVYASFSYVSNFLTSVRQVTAEFELQRVSLGAIIQDQVRANQLFSEIKSFALKSPVSILDLTKYTKQLAAYKVGWDGVKTDTKELFDWTKKLTDVSVGLGVSMDRVVLAFGQVRATGHLRASEVRQFTEMGVPIVEELAAKLSKLNGEAVTTAQVMDMISKRGISFEMVKDVFDDMTSAGGIFYNMQEKQGNTLYGMWAKLGDAASVMYDEIGNTESVNKGMKALIQALTDMMRNWQQIPRMMAYAGAATIAFVVRQKILKLETAKSAVIQRAYNIRIARANTLLASSTNLTKAHGAALRVQAVMLKGASTAAAAFGTSLTAIKSALITTGWGALIVALGYIADKLLFAKTNADKAAEAINKFKEETASETAKSVRDFEYLADKAVSAPKGSREQKEALEELERAYSSILPKELLELEYLEKLNGKYGSLTKTIREYVAEQQKRKNLEDISNIYGADKRKYEGTVTDYFREQGWTEGEIARFWAKFYDAAKDKSKTLRDVVRESLVFAGRDAEKDFLTIFRKLPENAGFRGRGGTAAKWFKSTFGGSIWNVDDIDMLRDVVLAETQTIEQYTERAKEGERATNAFAEAQEKAAKRLKEARLVGLKGEVVDSNSYLGSQMLANFEIKDITNILKDGFAQADLAWDKEYGNFINKISAKKPELISSLNFDAIIDDLIKALNNPELDESKRKFIENLLSLAQQSKKRYEEIVPPDPVVRMMRQRFDSIVDYTKSYARSMRQFRMNADEDMKAYRKRLSDEVELIKNNIKAWSFAMIVARTFRNKTEEQNLQNLIAEAKLQLADFEKMLGSMPKFEKGRSSRKKSDPRLQNLKEEISLLQKLYAEYKKLEKQEGAAMAAEDMRKLAGKTIDMFKTKYKIDLPTNADNLASSLEILYKKMEALGTKAFPTLPKDLAELRWTIENVKIEDLQKNIEAELKRLADRISRTKTAKEFYEKILSQTGDVELAANVAIHVYGEQGKDLNKQIRSQIEKLLEPSGIKIDESVFRKDGTFDPKKLREFAESQKDAIGGIESKAYQELIKLSDNADKDFAKTIEGWLKAIEKAKSASDKMLDLARTTRTEIDKISAQKGYAQTRITELLGLGTRTDEQQQELENLRSFLDVADKLIQGFKDKQAKEQTSLAYEMFKDSPMYVQMFDDLDHASTTMLENMKTRIEGLKGAWKDLTPTQLKELQSRMNEIDTQLAKRNPFKTLAKYISDYRTLRREGDSRGNKSEEAANADLMAASKAADEARKKYDELVKKYGKGSEETVKEVIDAKEKLDRAMANEEAAQKAVENWKKVKDMIGLSANELFQMLNWAGDIAKGIADISEAMGADEEDVQYWNDVADVLGQISGGIQDIVSAAMSGNVVGIISSALMAIPKMFVGFTNLFSAGKVRKANKEIKRQAELLEQLEYTYGRLEKAADKLFGREYLNNYNQQLRSLQAQQLAFQKQADAERSKGKKADKEKIKEHEEQVRDTADKIKELQDDLAAKIVGTDVASAARDFVNAWLDAYLSFSSTTDAIKEKFRDMIKNMVVESYLAQTVKNALQPIFDMIDDRLKDGELSEQDAADIIKKFGETEADIDDGLRVRMELLRKMGVDFDSMRDKEGEYSGIAKNIAGATSEEINSVAAIGNTLMYYVSSLPRIDENLSRVVAIMEGRGASAGTQTTSAGWTDWQKQAMDNYNAIARNTADTVVECRRAAVACEAATEKLNWAFRAKGATSGFNVFLNS